MTDTLDELHASVDRLGQQMRSLRRLHRQYEDMARKAHDGWMASARDVDRAIRDAEKERDRILSRLDIAGCLSCGRETRDGGDTCDDCWSKITQPGLATP